MINGKSILAIIPARGGSKGLPRKNILPLAGKPLIAWSIEVAKRSKFIDRSIVSTDDKEIADVAKKYGGDIPFMRPRGLATDESTTNDVILHAFQLLQGEYDIVLILQPTSPLRNAEDIDGALELMDRKNASAIVSVVKADHPPEWSFRLNNDMKMSHFAKQLGKGRRRQDYPDAYKVNGAIYASNVTEFLAKKTFFNKNTIAFVMPPERSVDIDTKIDFQLAQVILNRYNI